MKNLFLILIMAFFMSNVALAADVQLPPASETIAEEVSILEMDSFTKEFYHPEASFIKVHFERFNLPKGVTVEVSNPLGTEVYRYSKDKKDQFTKHGKDNGVSSFASISITGDRAIVRAVGDTRAVKAAEHSVVTDYQIVGFPEAFIEEVYNKFYSEMNGGVESTCGSVNNRIPTPCVKDSNPDEYDRARPTARILNGGGSLCTAWRVGNLNRLFTNHHCNSSQTAIAASETWFNYEYTDCARSGTTIPVKVAGETALKADYALDYMLYTVKNFESLADFGYHGLHPFPVDQDDRIYRIGHGAGWPKQIAYEDDLSSTGLCKADFPSLTARAPGSDIGYYCDSTGGSSGSPVLLGETNDAVALHHYGGCPNSGVKIELIWPQVSHIFGGVIPISDVDDPTTPPLQSPTAAFTVSCDGLTCDFDASSSSDPDGTIEAYNWDFGDDNTSTEGPTVQHVYAETGTYTATLTVRDNDDLPDSTEKTFGVAAPGDNNRPIADFSYVSDNNYTVQFTDESIDWDGTVEDWWWAARYGLEWDWFSTDGNPNPSLQFPIGGSFQVKLYVWDNENLRGVDKYKTVKVDGPIQNQYPVCNLDVDRASHDKIRINTLSYDPDVGQEIAEHAYYWGGHPGSIPNYYIGPDALQNEILEITAPVMRLYYRCTDPYYYSKAMPTQYWSPEPDPGPSPPVAQFSYTADRNVLSFRDRSYDNYLVVGWHWDFGDGTTSEEEDPVHEFPAVKDTYRVVLTVTDADGLSDDQFMDIYVNPIRIDTMTGATSKGNKGNWNVELKWEGAPGDNVRIKRNGTTVKDTANDGSETFSLKKNAKRDTWEVCTVDEVDCSKPINLVF